MAQRWSEELPSVEIGKTSGKQGMAQSWSGARTAVEAIPSEAWQSHQTPAESSTIAANDGKDSRKITSVHQENPEQRTPPHGGKHTMPEEDTSLDMYSFEDSDLGPLNVFPSISTAFGAHPGFSSTPESSTMTSELEAHRKMVEEAFGLSHESDTRSSPKLPTETAEFTDYLGMREQPDHLSEEIAPTVASVPYVSVLPPINDDDLVDVTIPAIGETEIREARAMRITKAKAKKIRGSRGGGATRRGTYRTVTTVTATLRITGGGR